MAAVLPNKTIKGVVATLERQQGAVAAQKIVENAISALQEQQAQGAVRNPGGFITAALRRGFTANQAKREARERARSQSAPPVTAPSAVEETRTIAPAATLPPLREPLDVITVAKRVDLALISGDQAAAIGQLQRLWEEGWQEAIEELCILHKRDWHFIITAQGVRDGQQ